MRTFLRGKVTLLFMMLGMLLAVPAIAFADIIAVDSDTVLADIQGSRDLGTFGPGVTVKIGTPPADAKPTVDFYLQCNGNQHLNQSATDNVTFNLAGSTIAKSGGGAFTGGSISAANASVTAPSNWITDGNNCNSPLPGQTTASVKGGSSEVTLVTPNEAGDYTYTVDYNNSLNPPEITGNPQATFTLTVVTNQAPAATDPTFNPASPKTNDVLQASTTTSDADNNNVSLAWVWKVTRGANTCQVSTDTSAAAAPGVRTVSLDLSPDADYTTTNCTGTNPGTINPSKGDTVVVEATPNDGTVNGTMHSSSVLIANSAPVCAAVSLTTNEEATGTANPSCTDADDDTLTYSIVAQGTKGTASVTGGQLQYEPNTDENGSDSFTYKANDGTAFSDPATVSVTINPVNDAPGAPSSGPGLAAGSNTPNNGVFKLDWGAASDVDGDTLSYELQHQDADDNGFTPVTGAGSLSTLYHQFTSTSKEDEGTWTYQVRASDGLLSSPFAGPSTAVKVDKTAPTFGACPTAGPFLVNSGIKQVTISAPSDPNLADGSSGTGVASSTLTGSVDTSSTGSKSVTFTATDGVGNQATKQCTFNVNTYNFSGFSSPVDNPTIVNYAKAGQAIPLKWRLMDGTTPVTNLQNVTVTVKDYSCGLNGSLDQVEEYAAGSSELQNLGNGYYQYNWKSPLSYAKSCKTLQINGEGMQLTATQQPLFQFTK